MAIHSSDVTIKVTPEVLNTKAQEVSAAVSQMERLFDSVQATVERTKFYWVGEAGNLNRKLFQEQKEDVREIISRLKEHPVNLQKIAKTYSGTEDTLTEAASRLPNDLID